MKNRLLRIGVALVLTLLLSSPVLAGPGQGQGDPPVEDPGGVCAVVAALPLPLPLIDALLKLLGCPEPCPDGQLPPC